MTWPWVALILAPAVAGSIVGVVLWLVWIRRKK